jgi:hypothetical protein
MDVHMHCMDVHMHKMVGERLSHTDVHMHYMTAPVITWPALCIYVSCVLSERSEAERTAQSGVLRPQSSVLVWARTALGAACESAKASRYG